VANLFSEICRILWLNIVSALFEQLLNGNFVKSKSCRLPGVIGKTMNSRIILLFPIMIIGVWEERFCIWFIILKSKNRQLFNVNLVIHNWQIYYSIFLEINLNIWNKPPRGKAARCNWA